MNAPLHRPLLLRSSASPERSSGGCAEPQRSDGEPSGADEVVSRRGLEEVEGVFLLVDGRARFRPVRTGITGGMDIEVLGGLDEGEEVVVGPYQKLRKLSEWDRAAIDAQRQKVAASVRQP